MISSGNIRECVDAGVAVGQGLCKGLVGLQLVRLGVGLVWLWLVLGVRNSQLICPIEPKKTEKIR